MKKILENIKNYLDKEEVHETEEYISAYSLYKKLDKNLEFARDIEDISKIKDKVNLSNEEPLTLRKRIKNQIFKEVTCTKVEATCYEMHAKLTFTFEQNKNTFNEIIFKYRNINEFEYLNCNNSKNYIEKNKEELEELLTNLEKYYEIFSQNKEEKIKEVIEESFFDINITYDDKGNIEINIIPKEEVLENIKYKEKYQNILNLLHEYILKRTKVNINELNPTTQNIITQNKKEKAKTRKR